MTLKWPSYTHTHTFICAHITFRVTSSSWKACVNWGIVLRSELNLTKHLGIGKQFISKCGKFSFSVCCVGSLFKAWSVSSWCTSLLESQGNNIRDKDSLQAHSVHSCTIISTAYFYLTQMAAKIFLQHAPKNTHAYLVCITFCSISGHYNRVS